MQMLDVVVNKSNGLHVRMAAALIQKLQALIEDTSVLSKIHILYNGRKSPVMSLLFLVSLKIKKGEKITLCFEEPVNPAILEEIRTFLETSDAQDSPEQTQTDRLLMENSITLEAVLSGLPNGVVVVNKDNRITYVNAEACRLLGLAEEQLLSRKASDVIPHSRLHRVLETGESELGKKQVLGNRVILTSRSPLWFEGRIEGAVALFQDISIIEDLKQELKEINALKKQLDLVLRSVEDYISLSDASGNFVYCNPQMDNLISELQIEANVKSIVGPSSWKKMKQTRSPLVQLFNASNGLSYVAKLNPVILEAELGGTVLTMSPLNEVKSLLNQLDLAEERTRYLEQELSRHEVLNQAFAQIVGNSDPLMESLFIANKVARTDSTVMITGESGTGKELVAKAIHEASSRNGKPFIRVNCAAIPANLIESELFGHEKGAFTGAWQMRRGKFELAHTGTIFLDEIGDLNLDLQAKILRVLQEREVERVGGSKTIPLDVRIITATHRDLRKMVQAGEFREDLYYRLNVIPIHLPPLRKRKADIPLLTDLFLGQLNKRLGTQVRTYEKAFLDALMRYDWPGNIRELQNILERAVSLCEGDTLLWQDLPEYIREPKNQVAEESHEMMFAPADPQSVRPMEEIEKEVLKHTIQYFPSYNMAAKALGLTHKTVASKVRKFGLEDYLGKKYRK